MTKAVLFDLDGTLLDTKEFVLQAVEHTLKTHGFNAPARHEITKLVGISLRKLYEFIEPLANSEIMHKTHTNFQIENIKLCKVFKGTIPTLKKLKNKGCKLGLVTARYNDTLNLALTHTKIKHFFDVIISADDVKNHKPNPEGILKALESLKIKPSEAIYIGDSVHDIKAAKKAGVKTVAVTFGFGEEKELIKEKPNYTIDSIIKIPQFVTS